MAVFTDATANTFDLTITNSGDWTIHTADFLNGDNSASLSTTLNQNAWWNGEQFCLPNGSGSEARTLEFWLKISAGAADRFVATVRVDSTATTGSSFHWQVYETSTEAIVANWLTTSAGNYMSVTTSAQSAGWHHYVVIWQCGSTRRIDVYIDGIPTNSSGAPSGTPTYDTSAAYAFFLGSIRYNSSSDMTDHLAKVAWYPRALTPAEIWEHTMIIRAT